MFYYRLNPEIYIMNEKYNPILCNVLTGEIIALNKTVANDIMEAEANIPFDLNENFNELIKIRWMQKYEKPVYIDKIRYTNIFNKKRAWKNLPTIETVILQLTKKCDMSCNNKQCMTSFCPMCTISSNGEDLSFEEWRAILNELNNLRPKSYILTGGNPILHSEFKKIYQYLQKQNADVFIHLHRAEDIDLFSANDNILFSTLTDAQKIKLLPYTKKQNIKIFDYKRKRNIVAAIKNKVTDHPEINRKSFFTKTAFGNVFTRMMYDNCLLGKIFILNDGSVVPCLGMTGEIIGNLEKDPLPHIMNQVYNDYWSVPVNERENSICSSCGYKFNCTSCIKFDASFCKMV